MSVLVTGAAGFIGSHLCERLVADGHRVRGIDAFTDYYERGRKEANLAGLRHEPAFELVEDDLATCDPALLTEDVGTVFHLAAQPGVRGSWGVQFEGYVRNNVLVTQRLLEVVRTRGLPLVYASSSSVYGAPERLPVTEEDRPEPVSPYGVTKLAGEHLAVLYARAYGMPVTAVRYFTVYGPRQRPDMAFARFVDAALRGAPIEVLGTGEQTRDFTFVADAVDATVRAAGGAPGRVYNVGGGNRASLNEAIAIIEELTGARLVVDRQPAAAGDPPHTAADHSRATAELGWRPQTSLRDGLATHVAWARENAG